MKTRELNCNGVVVKVTTKDDVQLACDLYGMSTENKPFCLLLDDIVEQDSLDFGGGIVICNAPYGMSSLWKDLVCRNRLQINRMLVERQSDTPDTILELMVNCEEPWVEWEHLGCTYFALLVDVCGENDATFYWAVACFDSNESGLEA